jgi:hypothetical protein
MIKHYVKSQRYQQLKSKGLLACCSVSNLAQSLLATPRTLCLFS